MTNHNWSFQCFRMNRYTYLVNCVRYVDKQVRLFTASTSGEVIEINEETKLNELRALIPVDWKTVSPGLRAAVRSLLDSSVDGCMCPRCRASVNTAAAQINARVLGLRG